MDRIELEHDQLAALGEIAGRIRTHKLAIETTNLHNRKTIAVTALVGSHQGHVWLVTPTGKVVDL